MAVSITFDRVTKTFGDLRAVDDVTLTIEAGELFFLLGPSGCGKTTLLRCLAGFYTPDHGTIRVGERDVTRLPPHQRDTGMVFQSYALWPHMTVAENVAFGLQMRRLGKADIARRVDEALEMVRMRDRARHKPNQLSGGQQQRVALARALVIRPQCLLLDEPLSNLDAKLRLDMRGEIRRICKEAGLTGLYVTHDQKEALSIADRLAVLHEGSIRQLGAPQDVYRRPASRFVANFIGETNFLEGRVTERDGAITRVSTALGELVSAAAPGDRPAASGEAVTVSIRPEAIRLDAAPGRAPNCIEGLAHDSVYLGEMAQHQIAAPADRPDAITLKVFDLNPRLVAREEAKRVRFWIAPEDVVLLRG